MTNKSIYVGLAFPYSKGTYGLPATVTDEELVRSDLVMLLNTRRGERVMLPSYGLDLDRFIFNNTGPLLVAKIQREIVNTIANNEPRVTIMAIDVAENQNTVDINVVYQINGLVDTVSLVKDKEGV